MDQSHQPPPDPTSLPEATLLGRTTAELAALAVADGQPAYRGEQLAGWLYYQGAREFAKMSNLPVAWREQLASRWQVGRGAVAAEQRSRDGTVKLLLELLDGARVECVLLPYPDRLSVCLSSQTGCAVGCTFCATGYLGAGRNLTVQEITDQLLTAGEAGSGRPVTDVVFMGMGEPLLNLAAVIAAVRLWREELNFSPRNVTVSTVGLPPAIAELAAAELPVTLAISLHAADDALRRKLIPTTAQRWSVAEVIEAARGYEAARGRRVTYEVVLLAGVTDQPEQARALAARLRPGEHVNLIPFNPVTEAPFGRPERRDVHRFHQILTAAGLNVTQRRTRGDDIAGACGQLQASSR